MGLGAWASGRVLVGDASRVGLTVALTGARLGLRPRGGILGLLARTGGGILANGSIGVSLTAAALTGIGFLGGPAAGLGTRGGVLGLLTWTTGGVLADCSVGVSLTVAALAGICFLSGAAAVLRTGGGILW